MGHLKCLQYHLKSTNSYNLICIYIKPQITHENALYLLDNYTESTIINEQLHGLQSLPPSPKRAERKGRRRPFREAGSGHKQWNTVSCVDTYSIISKFFEFCAENLLMIEYVSTQLTVFHCLCPLPASRKGIRLPLRSALFGEGGRDWRP